jgi:tetratricopeptide (TPR) repeat protein
MLKSYSGKHREAIGLHKQALIVIERSAGKNSHMSAETNNDIGVTYQSLGLPKISLEYFQVAENIFRKLYGNEHSDVATVISNRASSLNQLGLFNDVTILQSESIRIAEATYGRKSTDVAIRLGHIGSSLVNQNKLEEARPYILESLDIGEAVFGKVHDRYSDNLRVYARYLSASGSFKEAEAAFNETIHICKKVYKTESHSEISDSLNGLGELYRRIGDGKKSKEYVEKALNMYISLGSNQKKIMKYKLNLAKTQLLLKEKESAKNILKKIIAYYKKNKGYSSHPDSKEAKTLFEQLTSNA